MKGRSCGNLRKAFLVSDAGGLTFEVLVLRRAVIDGGKRTIILPDDDSDLQLNRSRCKLFENVAV